MKSPLSCCLKVLEEVAGEEKDSVTELLILFLFLRLLYLTETFGFS